jgi:hypothetical protein
MKAAPSELNRLLEAALDDQRQEKAFFQALIDSRVYCHCPKNTSPGSQFIQFRGPNGDLLLPFFSDKAKADRAAQGKLRVVALQGRDFLQRTLGATLVLNPNDRWCKLYPDEVRHLLVHSELPNLETESLSMGTSVDIHTESVPPPGLEPFLNSTLRLLNDVERGYLADMRLSPQDEGPHWVLIAISAAAAHERTARNLVARSQPFCAERQIQFSVMVYAPGDPNDRWISDLFPQPFYRQHQ